MLNEADHPPWDKDLEKLYEEYFGRLVRHLTIAFDDCSREDAEDVAQATIMVLSQVWDKVSTYDRPSAYWVKAARNTYRRNRGKSARCVPMDPDLLPHHERPADALATVDLRETLHAAIRKLPRRQRDVISLRGLEDFSESDTARILDVSVGTVKTHLHHARKRLRGLLGDSSSQGGEPD